MKIDKNNYEEYFLLYADNELSAEERIEVEHFVRENTSFKRAFDEINMTIIRPEENLRSLDKSFLYKKITTLNINERNYEEIFVLYHDGELNEEGQRETLTFLEAHPQLKQSFDLLGQSKIKAETIIFPSKSSLYRKVSTAGNGRVIFFRSLAAAAIAGLLLWGSLSYLDFQNNPGKLALQTSDKPSVEKGKTDETAQKKTGPENKIAPDNKLEDTRVTPSEPGEQATPSLAGKKSSSKAARGNYVVKKIPNRLNTPSLATDEVEKPDNKMLAKITPEEIPTELRKGISAQSHIDIDMTETIKEPVHIARTVVYLDVEEEKTDDFNLFNLPINELQKTKLGIFLKKVKRIAERNDPIKRLFEEDKNLVVINK